jgi:hypothetical protein
VNLTPSTKSGPDGMRGSCRNRIRRVANIMKNKRFSEQ